MNMSLVLLDNIIEQLSMGEKEKRKGDDERQFVHLSRIEKKKKKKSVGHFQ
jgi:hypothetical protein